MPLPGWKGPVARPSCMRANTICREWSCHGHRHAVLEGGAEDARADRNLGGSAALQPNESHVTGGEVGSSIRKLGCGLREGGSSAPRFAEPESVICCSRPFCRAFMSSDSSDVALVTEHRACGKSNSSNIRSRARLPLRRACTREDIWWC